MKQLTALFLLLSFVACGERSSSSNKGNEGNPRRTCDTSDQKSFLCTLPLTYILNTRVSDVPKNIRLDIIRVTDGREEFRYTGPDACKVPNIFTIVSNSTGSSIFFKGRPMLGAGTTLELIDQGDDCKGNTVIVKTLLTEEDIRLEQSEGTLNVDLD